MICSDSNGCPRMAPCACLDTALRLLHTCLDEWSSAGERTYKAKYWAKWDHEPSVFTKRILSVERSYRLMINLVAVDRSCDTMLQADIRLSADSHSKLRILQVEPCSWLIHARLHFVGPFPCRSPSPVHLTQSRARALRWRGVSRG